MTCKQFSSCNLMENGPSQVNSTAYVKCITKTLSSHYITNTFWNADHSHLSDYTYVASETEEVTLTPLTAVKWRDRRDTLLCSFHNLNVLHLVFGFALGSPVYSHNPKGGRLYGRCKLPHVCRRVEEFNTELMEGENKIALV